MKQFAVVALVTAVGFIAGIFAGRYLERHSPLPAPPIALFSEFNHGPRPNSRWTRPINRAELVKRIQAIQPQLQAFEKGLEDINAEFSRNFEAILTADQRARYTQRRRVPPHARDNSPLSDDRIVYLLREEPERTVLWDVVIPIQLDHLTADLKLDDAQREQLRALLRKRRGEFLALIDSSPPPSVQLYRLAPYVQRLQGAAPPPPPAHP